MNPRVRLFRHLSPIAPPNSRAISPTMLTLEQFGQELRSLKAGMPAPDRALVETFLRRIATWPDDSTSLEALLSDLDRLLGEVWFSTHERHALIFLSIARFRDTVSAVGGMTMNERLSAFGLDVRWERAADPERMQIYSKVGAKP